jgi:hypothetical protein
MGLVSGLKLGACGGFGCASLWMPSLGDLEGEGSSGIEGLVDGD